MKTLKRFSCTDSESTTRTVTVKTAPYGDGYRVTTISWSPKPQIPYLRDITTLTDKAEAIAAFDKYVADLRLLTETEDYCSTAKGCRHCGCSYTNVRKVRFIVSKRLVSNDEFCCDCGEDV